MSAAETIIAALMALPSPSEKMMELEKELRASAIGIPSPAEEIRALIQGNTTTQQPAFPRPQVIRFDAGEPDLWAGLAKAAEWRAAMTFDRLNPPMVTASPAGTSAAQAQAQAVNQKMMRQLEADQRDQDRRTKDMINAMVLTYGLRSQRDVVIDPKGIAAARKIFTDVGF